MLQLIRLEIEGFGPFTDRQVIEFPEMPGVVVIYGENMRGKTTLLNAIRYVFFGHALGRGSRQRRLHTLSNRELAAEGRYGFSVGPTFNFDGDPYELVRSCEPIINVPEQDNHYRHEVMLRRRADVLGPQERDQALERIFPSEISRFFLFDGELLQEYEELIIHESEVGPQISNAIERILGVPFLKAGRRHLRELADEADKEAAKEASRHRETEALGNALGTAIAQRRGHQDEQHRLQGALEEFQTRKAEIEAKLSADRRYADILARRDAAVEKARSAAQHHAEVAVELRRAMSEAWRSVLRDPIRNARAMAQQALQTRLLELQHRLRAAALESGHCEVCDQELSEEARRRLTSTLSTAAAPLELGTSTSSLRDLGSFRDADNAGEVRQLMRRLQVHAVDEKTARDEVNDLNAMLRDVDPASMRSTQASYSEIIEQITILKAGLEGEAKKISELDANISRLHQKLGAASPRDLEIIEARTRLLRDSAAVFNDAVEAYKDDLRGKVEASASELFLAMTTEKKDYARLSINSDYGLTIIHQDGRPEEARSAGAEHVVALALMGALQKNAPLRGPIVMDSPFGRLDEQHTSNVVSALHLMAAQVVLLVYESEIGRRRARELLGSRLISEYELVKVNSRRTDISKVQ